MKNPNQINQNNSIRNAALAFAATLAASGALAPSQAEAVEPQHFQAPDPIATTATPQVETVVNRHKQEVDYNDSNQIPGEVRKYMRKNTVYFKELSCSGQAIRNKNGHIIGALTAAHCSLEKPNSRKEVDGKQYIVQPEPVIMRTGPTRGKLTRTGTINQWILPKKGDKNHDIAIGVAEGFSPQEVLDAYKAKALTPRQISSIKYGENVYMSGWPKFKPGNKTSLDPQQSFRMFFNGKEKNALIKGGKSIKLAWAVMARNKHGAVCSFGASGSEGFVMIDGEPRSIGTLAAFQDLTETVPGGDNAHAPTQKELKSKNIAAFCGFSYIMPSPATHDIVQSVRSEKELPGYQSFEQIADAAREQIKDPTAPKAVIKGYVNFTINPESTDPAERQIYTVKDPVLVHNERNKTTVLAAGNGAGKDGIYTYSVRDTHLSYIAPFSTSEGDPVVTTETFGLKYVSPRYSGPLLGTNDQIYGTITKEQPLEATGSQSLMLENGAYVIRPYQGMK